MTQEQADKKYTELVTRLGDFQYQKKNAMVTVQILDANIKKLEGEIDSLINTFKSQPAAEKAANVTEMKPNGA